MKLLVLTSDVMTADQLRGALDIDVRPQDAEVMVVVPALHENALRFWLSDADEAIARAREISRETVDQLGDAGVSASGDTGEGDPVEAIADALRTFSADRIVLLTHPESEQRYREDLDVTEIEQRFGLPVDQANVPSSAV
jgi:hypothetical protein